MNVLYQDEGGNGSPPVIFSSEVAADNLGVK
jgi:hypothetical protein